ncbi:MAG: hypothetical protein AB7W16_21085 [Candidatus Obscuribacterales bacterium]
MSENDAPAQVPAPTSPDKGSRKSRFRSPRFWLKSLALFALAYLIAVPFVHPLLVMAWSVMPIIALPLIGIPLGLLIARKFRKTGISVVTLAVLLTAGVTAVNFTDWFVDSQIASYIAPTRVSAMPVSVNNRLLPRPTALHYAENSNTDNRLRVGRPHLLADPKGDRMFWQVPLHYDVWYGRILGSTGGVARVNAGATGQQAETMPDSGFLYGDESWVADVLFKWLHPFSEKAEVVYWQNDDGSWVILTSYVSYNPSWTGAMIPVVKGVMEIGQNGMVHNYSISEASVRYPGAALFPEKLGRRYAEAYAKYKHGLVNYWVYQKDLLMISEDTSLPDDETGGNHPPFFQEFQGMGLQLVAPMEPSGNSSSALTEVLFFDGITGKARSFSPTHVPPLNGPRQAFKNVHKADNQADWPDFAALEGKLVTKDHNRYWLFTVIRKDGESHAFVMLVLVDGYTLDAYKFLSKDELDKFLENAKPSDGHQP